MSLLVDNSVWQRITKPGVLDTITSLSHDEPIVTATPQILEYCHSARNPDEYDRSMQTLSAFQHLNTDTECHRHALDIQRALWHGGKVRGAGTFDILIAAIAHRHGATVIHYDKNFDTIALVLEGFRQEWIAPAGTLD